MEINKEKRKGVKEKHRERIEKLVFFEIMLLPLFLKCTYVPSRFLSNICPVM
jgi:hypothetical protein